MLRILKQHAKSVLIGALSGLIVWIVQDSFSSWTSGRNERARARAAVSLAQGQISGHWRVLKNSLEMSREGEAAKLMSDIPTAFNVVESIVSDGTVYQEAPGLVSGLTWLFIRAPDLRVQTMDTSADSVGRDAALQILKFEYQCADRMLSDALDYFDGNLGSRALNDSVLSSMKWLHSNAAGFAARIPGYFRPAPSDSLIVKIGPALARSMSFMRSTAD